MLTMHVLFFSNEAKDPEKCWSFFLPLFPRSSARALSHIRLMSPVKLYETGHITSYVAGSARTLLQKIGFCTADVQSNLVICLLLP